MKTYKIASIPGDGIGVEVVAAGLRALYALAERAGTFRFEVMNFDWGTDRYKREGTLMPADGAQDLIGFDAILFGPKTFSSKRSFSSRVAFVSLYISINAVGVG